MNLNVTCSVSLESYHPYLQPQKVFKNQKIYSIHISLSKSTKSYFGSLGPLGIKDVIHIKTSFYKVNCEIERICSLTFKKNVLGMLRLKLQRWHSYNIWITHE